VISLKEGLLVGSPFQQYFIKSSNNIAAGLSSDITGIGGYEKKKKKMLFLKKMNIRKIYSIPFCNFKFNISIW